MKKNVNGIEVEMTADEIAEIEAERAKQKDIIAQEKADREAKENLKASAKSKLIAGEPLTEEEAATIVP